MANIKHTIQNNICHRIIHNMNKIPLIGTGLSGLVGSRIVDMMTGYQIEDISRKTGTDILNRSELLRRIESSPSAYVIHMAAYTNVDQAEIQESLGENSDAYQLNVTATQYVIEACQRSGKHLIHCSTDMVFSGDTEAGHHELDETHATGWYAQTKELGEKAVRESAIPWTIVRLAYPYRATYEKKEYVRIFKWLLEEKKQIQCVSDHYFTPTFIDDLAGVFDYLITHQLRGIVHAGGGQRVSPYEAALKVADVFGLDSSLITPTTRHEYFSGKAPRAYNLSLINDTLSQLPVAMHTFDQGLSEIKRQMEEEEVQ